MKPSRPRQIGLRKIFRITIGSVPINIHSVFPRIGMNEFKMPAFYTVISILTGNKKNTQLFDLRTLTATMKVHKVPPVLSRSFAVFKCRTKKRQKTKTE